MGLLVGNLPLLRILLLHITAARRWQSLEFGFGFDHIPDPLDQSVQSPRIIESWAFLIDKMLKVVWGDKGVIETLFGMMQ
ncbi:MAG: hypothetical protein GX604_03760 [Actinobacteria bacterium]|nr:hypothetical protein [Actinomycetota bacterium]